MLSANKANETAWIVSLTSDICKHHFLCFVTIIHVKVISGHQVKKVFKKSGFRAAILVCRSNFRIEREKMTLKTF